MLKQHFFVVFALLISFVVTSCVSNDKNKEGIQLRTKGESNIDELIDEYNDPVREEWQNPDLIVSRLGNVNEKVIADIGAGSGYFTFPLARQGAEVIAIDIEERFLSYINERVEELGSPYTERIETRIAETDDPGLSEDEVDIILIVNTITFIKNKEEYLKNLRKSVQDGGQLFIVDFKKESSNVGPSIENRISSADLLEILKAAGWNNNTIDRLSLPYQYIIKSEKL